jgi:hypothetical protein
MILRPAKSGFRYGTSPRVSTNLRLPPGIRTTTRLRLRSTSCLGCIRLRSVDNYPNPFYQYTLSATNTTVPTRQVEAEISVYTTTGALVYARRSTQTLDTGESGKMTWDGTGKDGKKLEPGVYVYRLSVRSKADNAATTYSNRLVLVR